MKKERLLWVGFGSSILLSPWAAVEFYETQKKNFEKIQTEHKSLQRSLKTLEDDLTFVKDHQNEINFLAAKGWFVPKNRLIAAEVLEKLQSSLNDVQYTFEPETVRTLGDA